MEGNRAARSARAKKFRIIKNIDFFYFHLLANTRASLEAEGGPWFSSLLCGRPLSSSILLFSASPQPPRRVSSQSELISAPATNILPSRRSLDPCELPSQAHVSHVFSLLPSVFLTDPLQLYTFQVPFRFTCVLRTRTKQPPPISTVTPPNVQGAQ